MDASQCFSKTVYMLFHLELLLQLCLNGSCGVGVQIDYFLYAGFVKLGVRTFIYYL